MARETEPTLIKRALASGKNAARAKGPSPRKMETMPIMIASTATIVTVRGRFLNDSLSVLYQLFDSLHQYNTVGELIL